MAGNRRGRIKEHLEGVHKNCNWITEHVLQSLELIKDESPPLTKGLTALGKVAEELDTLTMMLYKTI